MKITIKTFLLLLLISFSGISFSQTCQQWVQKIEASRQKIEMNRMKLAELERMKAKPILTRSYINTINKEKLLKAEYQNEYKLCMGNNKKLSNENKAQKTKTEFDTERKLAKQKEQEQIKAKEQCTLLAKQIEACRVAIETARAQLMPLENSAGPTAKINSLKTQINNEKAKKVALQQKYMKCGAGNEAQAKLANANKDNKTMTNALANSTRTKEFNKAKQAEASAQRQNQLANKERTKNNEQEKKCLSIGKQIEACRVTIEAARAKLLPLENSKSPFNKSKIQALQTQINSEKTKKAALQQQYMTCGTGAKFANSNKDNKTITKDKAAQTASKKTALIAAWEKEFELTKEHTIQYTLSNNYIIKEFEKFLTNIEFSEENLLFYKIVNQPPTSWNLRQIKKIYLTREASVKSSLNSKSKTINIKSETYNNLDAELLKSNFIVNSRIIQLMKIAQAEVLKMMGDDTFSRFTKHMNALVTNSKKPGVKK